MKRLPLYFALTALVLVLAWLGLTWPREMFAPGPVQPAHTELAEASCYKCHALGRGVPAQNCLACHKLKDIGVVSTKGVKLNPHIHLPFHQHLLANDCRRCHLEHRGSQAYRSPQSFSHDLLQPAVREDCASCHRKPADELHRQAGNQCLECHQAYRWKPASFAHEEFFRFDRHHPAQCNLCHVQTSFKSYTCYECHEHSPAKIEAEHLEEGIRDFDDCARCHRSGDEDEARGGDD
jgi:hypothetical protein